MLRIRYGSVALIFLLTAACAGPRRPGASTAAPSLGAAQKTRSEIRSNVIDAKDHIYRSRTLNQQIGDKLMLLEGKG